MSGPLSGLRVLEFAGIGPGPFCGMMLADHGAEVIRIDRIDATVDRQSPLLRSRRSIALDLKKDDAREIVFELVKTADGLIEGFRPGVMERLGLGPEALLTVNEKLVYGRMTGWGQTGPYAAAAGHDINYISLSGALHQCGRAGQKPTPPVNYLGDFGGGGMMLAFGMVSALLAVRNGANGQVIDCAMTDGSALITATTWGAFAKGDWLDQRGVNRLDTGAFYYDTYETKDGKWVSIGSLEPQFYALLRDKAGLDDKAFDSQVDASEWPKLKERIAGIFLSKTRDEWCEIMEMTDVCFAPVLSMSEAPRHPHNAARGTFISIEGVVQPRPAPAYSVTKTEVPVAPPELGADTAALLEEIGVSATGMDSLRRKGIVG